MNNFERLHEELTENAREDKAKAKKLAKWYYDEYKGNYKKAHKAILSNVVNSGNPNNSNQFVAFLWDEVKKLWPS